MPPQDETHDEVLPSMDDPPAGERWLAPALREQRLYELCRDGGDEAHLAYLRIVAAEGLYRPVALGQAVGSDGAAPLHVTTLPDGRRLVQVYTVGVLPRPHPDVVYEFITLRGLISLWPRDVRVLLVNGATPCARAFLAGEDERETWLGLHDELFEPDGTCDRIETRRTGMPHDEGLLRGLACGAHLCYGNGDAWNTLDWHGAGYSSEVERLAGSWGIDGHDSWLDTTELLLAAELSPWVWDYVLGARLWLAQETGERRVDPVVWRDCVEQSIRSQLQDEVSGEELDDLAASLRGLAGKIMRYESRFRADGLLPPDGYVRTVAAWDLGRATMVARWGRGARYAGEQELHAAVERAGKAVQAAYGSWPEFSAGYILGRCLHFDEETFGDWYTTVLDAHRALLAAPDSPWNTVPLH
ncbi:MULTISPECIES: DUF1266 domain-containing protein [Nonomuraea]|uniref:DUF1266 domain-containing protein n=2 Tax=Nonomuraea TaxID=83681 RepID=A0ABW1BLL0_9ACTN|nr:MULTISPECIES: DUF1266 domain-containing protein [Nonomuraea]MDA0639879.1 DUF1266 domain-containing protein [Nonomuraea ferruginea]